MKRAKLPSIYSIPNDVLQEAVEIVNELYNSNSLNYFRNPDPLHCRSREFIEKLELINKKREIDSEDFMF